MPRASSFPFLRPSTDPLARCGAWMLHASGSGPVPLEDYVEDWDYHVDIRLTRDIRIDPAQLREECCLAPSTELLLKAAVHCPSADYGKRQVSYALDRHVIAGYAMVQRDLDVLIPGSHIFSVFELTIEIVLAGDQAPGARNVACKAGARLWEDRKKTRIEGRIGRFPVQEANLVDRGNGNCAWKLQWNAGDWEEDYYQGLLLLLNTANPAVKRAIEAKDPLFHSMMRYDVARQLLVAALRSSEFVSQEEEYGEDTMGYFARALIGRCFPGREISALASELEASPGDFEVRLQHVLGLMEIA